MMYSPTGAAMLQGQVRKRFRDIFNDYQIKDHLHFTRSF